MNRMFFTLVLFVFTFSICFAQEQEQEQEKEKILTDSTLVLGFIKDDFTSVCKEVSSYICSCYSDFLDKSTIVTVSGVKTCRKSSGGKTDFFEIIYKNKTYFIEKNKLFFAKNIDYFSEISNLSTEELKLFKINAKNIAAEIHLKTIREALDFLDKCKTKGLAILHWSIYDESEYTEGTSFKIEFYNPTKKTIKYITTTLVGYNPVGDRVYNSRKQSYNVQVKSVGPIEPESSGSYSFDYVWFTDMVESAKIISITVEYMDGSVKTITDANSIRLDRKLYNYIKED